VEKNHKNKNILLFESPSTYLSVFTAITEAVGPGRGPAFVLRLGWLLWLSHIDNLVVLFLLWGLRFEEKRIFFQSTEMTVDFKNPNQHWRCVKYEKKNYGSLPNRQ